MGGSALLKKVVARPRGNFICWVQSLSGRLFEGCMIQVRQDCCDRCSTRLAQPEANASRPFRTTALYIMDELVLWNLRPLNSVRRYAIKLLGVSFLILLIAIFYIVC